MPWTAFKLVAKAKNVTEVAIVLRVLLGLTGVFVLLPVGSAILTPNNLVASDFIGLVVFTAVGVWLIRVAYRGSE